MADLEVRPQPGQDVVIIAPAGETFPTAPWRNSSKARARLPGSTVTVVVPPDPPPPSGTLPAETAIRYAPTPSLPLPAKLQPITDPVFGTKVTRISDPGQRHGYSRRQPWSPDEKYLLLEKGGGWLLNGKTYAPIKQVSYPDGPQWISNTELIGCRTNRLVRYNVETGNEVVEYTHTAPIRMGDGEGCPSADGRYVPLMSGATVMVFDRTTKTIKTKTLPAAPNNCTMSRKGQFLIVGGNVAGTGAGQGTDLYTRDLVFVRKIDQYISHTDPGIDANGKDVLAMCGQSKPRLYNLEGTGYTVLMSVATAYGSSHVSCFGPPGWALYSNYEPGGTLPGNDQVCSIKMDGSGKVMAWGHVHAGTNVDYEAQPQAVVSPSGTRVLAASEWGTAQPMAFIFEAGAPSPLPDPEPEPEPPAGGSNWDDLPASVKAWSKPPDGWKVTARDTFDRDIAQGEWGRQGGPEAFPKMSVGGWRWRPTAQSDDEGNDSSDRGYYDGPNTCWVEDGEMREFIRYGKKDVLPFKHDPAGVPLVNRPLVVGPEHQPSVSNITRRSAYCVDLYAQYPASTDGTFKSAHLFWGHGRISGSATDRAGYAEYDFPEFQHGSGSRGNAFFHNAELVGGQDAKQLNTDMTQWHHFRLVYHAKGYRGHPTGYAEAWIDGKLVLRKTTNISTRDLYYAKQTETYLAKDRIAGEPDGPPLTSSGPAGIIRTRLFQISEPE